MKKPKTLRIPRKLKKKYKKLWLYFPYRKSERTKDILIIKDSIRYGIWHNGSETKEVWGCMTRPR